MTLTRGRFVDSARDLARVDPWQQSLERSKARRERSRRERSTWEPSPEPSAPPRTRRPRRAARPRLSAVEASDQPRISASGIASASASAWPARVRRWFERAGGLLSLMPRLGPRSVAGLALLSAIVASDLAGGSQASTAPTRAAAHIPASLASAKSSRAGAGLAAGAAGWRSCPLAATPAGYVNPLAGAVVKSERVDQGVDYAGSGTLEAIGAGRITHVATSNTGWPGAFVEYQLTAGADAGCYVYYAEGVTPAPGLAVGQTVTGGQTLATIIPNYPTGIELGWGSGKSTKAYAKLAGQWSPTDDQDNVATAAGKTFSSLIEALGGPPGKIEG
jgi:hypothetical protein